MKRMEMTMVCSSGLVVWGVGIAAVAGLLMLIVPLILYFGAFFNANTKDVTHKILTGKDYEPYYDAMNELIDRAVVIPYEPVSIRSFDGKKLSARYYHSRDGAPLHIEFNGYKGNGIRDFSGGMQLALKRKENVLLCDQRSHGESEGHTISFGILERRDVQSWTKYAAETMGEGVPIFLEGVSMGAATVLMASELELPENVRGILADCPYSSALDIILNTVKGIFGFSAPFKPFFLLSARMFGHFDLMECSAAEAVSRSKLPVLIIHGTGDHYVPMEMSLEIARKAAEDREHPNKVRHVAVDGAPHGLSYVKDYPKYKEAYTEFMNDALKEGVQ